MKTGIVLKAAQIFYWLLLAVSVVLIIAFYVNNGNVNGDDPFSKQIADFGPILNLYIIWGYILFGLAVFFTLIFPLANMVSNPKSGLKTLISVAILGVLLFITYQLGDDTIMQIPGYDGNDNVADRLKLTDMGIFMMYIMLGGAILAMVYSSISKMFK